MIANRRLCIVGLGLMGGSLAQALRPHVAHIVGVDRHAATRQQALADGVVDATASSLAAAAPEADVIVLATPVKTITRTIAHLPTLKPAGCFVLDLGSTKQVINEAMAGLPDSFAALGGHPMCGKEIAGYGAADPRLFMDKTFVLTRNARTTPEIEDYMLELVQKVGANPLFLAAQRHDELVAAASHLPYVIAATLMRTVSHEAEPNLWAISASGFRDTTRLAGSDPHMLLDILQTNRDAVLDKIAAYQATLAAFSALLQGEDERALTEWLSAAQRAHNIYRQEKHEGRAGDNA